MVAVATEPSLSLRSRLSAGLLVVPGVLWLLVFFLVPLLIIFVVSFGSKDATGHVVLTNPGLQNYVEATKPEFLPAFANSVRYSLLTTILSLLIGYPIAYWISRHGGRHSLRHSRPEPCGPRRGGPRRCNRSNGGRTFVRSEP